MKLYRFQAMGDKMSAMRRFFYPLTINGVGSGQLSL